MSCWIFLYMYILSIQFRQCEIKNRYNVIDRYTADLSNFYKLLNFFIHVSFAYEYSHMSVRNYIVPATTCWKFFIHVSPVYECGHMTMRNCTVPATTCRNFLYTHLSSFPNWLRQIKTEQVCTACSVFSCLDQLNTSLQANSRQVCTACLLFAYGVVFLFLFFVYLSVVYLRPLGMVYRQYREL
jgi:hypothetical protein